MESSIFKGKNVEEAIQTGLDTMKLSENEVDIQIIQHETKGILGLMSKPAIVQLNKRHDNSTHEEVSKGHVEVATSECVETPKTVKEIIWNISLDKLKLKALLEVKVIEKEIKMDEELVLDSLDLNHESLFQGLSNLNVTYGIKHHEINRVVEKPEEGIYVIAEGIEPIPGKDGWIEKKINVDNHVGLKEKKDGKVDFRETRVIATAEKGSVIATIHPPVQGETGITVTNEEIEVKEASPIQIKAGNGVAFAGKNMMATESGRPSFEQKGQLVKVSVVPTLTHKGNVDLASGNIHFMGDVKINGEVKDNMVVESEGEIVVNKSVHNSKLIAAKGIVTYGNVASSEVIVSKPKNLKELEQSLEGVSQVLSEFIKVIGQLSNKAKMKEKQLLNSGLQPIIQLLLKSKYQQIPILIVKYQELLRRENDLLNQNQWEDIDSHLTRIFITNEKEFIQMEEIMNLSVKMNELKQLNQLPAQPPRFITIPSALNSSIYCEGDIQITGQGCINTNIRAGGSLKIQGILRGGETYGHLGIEVNEAGSDSGTLTVLKVPANQKISINKAMEGTTLIIGPIKYTCSRTMNHVHASLDEVGRMVFK